MNEDAIEEAGIKPLEPILEVCEQARDPEQRAEALGVLAAKYGVNAFMGIYAGPDKSDANHTICNVVQCGLGLPDRDYYFDEDKADKRELYKEHVKKMLALLDPNGYNHEHRAKQVFDLEIEIAGAHLTRTERRDPVACYNKMSIAEMQDDLCEGKFNFMTYFKHNGKEAE